jgi:DNA-directed RNA polymerase subunit H (RpoH/RPB5)
METEELFDLVARTRPVILEILNDQGYDTKAYENQSPADLVQLALGGPKPLRIRVPAKEGGLAPTKRTQVFYWVFERVKMSLERRVSELWDKETFGDDAADESQDQAIIILNESAPLHDAFHLMAIRQWQLHKRRVVFFLTKQLIANPARHVLQPKFRRVPATEQEAMNRLRLKNKKNLPLIKFHTDIMTRVLALVPDDVVEILSPSPTSGDYIKYRICAV